MKIKNPPPASLATRIEALGRNLWWTWNSDAQRLFASLDPVLWDSTGGNPIAMRSRLSRERWRALEADADLHERLGACEQNLQQYLSARTWFERTVAARDRKLLVAYFCAEFAIHECLPQYAGGLGVLAGDHLKSASDLGIPLVAIGLFYRNGYYQQQFASDGTTQASYPSYDPAHLPLQDTSRIIDVPLGDRRLYARVWRADVGRTRLFLLDADLPRNPPALRAVTRRLYGGDSETRIQQEILLGIGGLRALDALHVRPTAIHLNEGHAAFAALELLRRRIKAGDSIPGAIRKVAAHTVFTTHTPVPAGHDRFDLSLVHRFLGAYARDMAWPLDRLMALGSESPAAQSFCMTALALRLSGHCNGVSALNGEVARRMWAGLYPKPAAGNAKAPRSQGSADADHVPIRHVTNGVHPQTWLAPEAEPFYERYLKPRWVGAAPDDDWWVRVDQAPDQALWELRCLLRAKLVHFIRMRLVRQLQRRGASLERIAAAWQTLDPGALTLGFARRFATYKRAPLIFAQPKRLAAILNDARRSVQIVFAGKAHPRDREGQEFAQRIHQWADRPEFRRRVVLLENYDMQVGRVLISGCDVWLNTPLRPREASGTSGMKPPLHGGLNCSILDGWWPEAYNRINGWAIGSGKEERGGPAVDRRDSDAIYRLLEEQIVPAFYRRDRHGVPAAWVRKMRASMKSVCARFSAHRMLMDYLFGYYLPAGAGRSPAPPAPLPEIRSSVWKGRRKADAR